MGDQATNSSWECGGDVVEQNMIRNGRGFYFVARWTKISPVTTHAVD